MTVHPMVRTRKKVPINSARYLFIADLLQTLDGRAHEMAWTVKEFALYY